MMLAADNSTALSPAALLCGCFFAAEWCRSLALGGMVWSRGGGVAAVEMGRGCHGDGHGAQGQRRRMTWGGGGVAPSIAAPLLPTTPPSTFHSELAS